VAVTIQEVARAARVSPSTVSNVLNGRDRRMLPATRVRVEEAIAALGYRPNRAARQLRTGRIQMLGLVVPSVANPFWVPSRNSSNRSRCGRTSGSCCANSERDAARESSTGELWADGNRSVLLCRRCPRSRTRDIPAARHDDRGLRPEPASWATRH